MLLDEVDKMKINYNKRKTPVSKQYVDKAVNEVAKIVSDGLIENDVNYGTTDSRLLDIEKVLAGLVQDVDCLKELGIKKNNETIKKMLSDIEELKEANKTKEVETCQDET